VASENTPGVDVRTTGSSHTQQPNFERALTMFIPIPGTNPTLAKMRIRRIQGVRANLSSLYCLSLLFL